MFSILSYFSLLLDTATSLILLVLLIIGIVIVVILSVLLWLLSSSLLCLSFLSLLVCSNSDTLPRRVEAQPQGIVHDFGDLLREQRVGVEV